MDGSKSATVQLQLIRAFSVVEKPFLFFDLAALTMLKPQNQNIKKAVKAAKSEHTKRLRLKYNVPVREVGSSLSDCYTCKDCLIKESIFPQKK